MSIDAQRRQLVELAQARGLPIVAEFADAVESGKDDDRPGFQSMLRELRNPRRGWDTVLVLDTARIARRRHLSIIFEESECKKAGVRVIYKSLPESDPITEMLLKSILQAMDEWHSLTSKAKGLSGMAENVRQGFRAGGSAPKGYRLESIATGTEAASPADPAVPAGKIAIARLAMTVGMVSITNSIITDLRAPAMAFGGGSTFTAISTNTTLTIGQSGGRFKLTGAATAVTLPTPSGNANTSFLLWGGDANTQTISPAASSFKMPDGTTPTSYSVTANQGIEVVSDGSVYQVVRMVGKEIAQTPAPGDNSTQVATTAFVLMLVPPGAVLPFAMNTVPPGWLAADGSSLSTTTYAALFAAIGYTYGGSGASFSLPDLRGYFVRGSGTNGDGTASGTFGAKQADDFKAHTHTTVARQVGTDGSSVASGGAALQYNAPTSSSGGAETRPKNIAMLYCIKT